MDQESAELSIASHLEVLSHSSVPVECRERCLNDWARRAFPTGTPTELAEFKKYWREQIRLERERQRLSRNDALSEAMSAIELVVRGGAVRPSVLTNTAGRLNAIRVPEPNAGSTPKPSTKESPAHSSAAEGLSEQSKAAELRSAVVLPILKKKHMTRSQWAKETGVDPSMVYDYLAGRSTPRSHNRQSLAEAIGLTESELPQ